VFFVLSGFLISTILFAGLETGTFRLGDFYRRRARRIFPALILVLAVALTLGWLMLFPDEFAELGTHAAAGAGFVANLVLWRESGYFDTAASLKPLLHLWSLGVEEQFYLVFPLVLWLASRWRANLLVVTAAVAIASFGWNMQVAAHDPVADFYSPLTRFWELMIGALIAYGMRRRTLAWAGEPSSAWRHVVSAVGGILLIVGFVTIRSDQPFPGAWALLPTIGAGCLIAAGADGAVNRWLAVRPLVWIGLISYPLYLWHVVLLVLARIHYGGTLAAPMTAALVALSMLLAWGTYLVVERPLRFGGRGTAKAWSLAAGLAVVAIAGLMIADRSGLPRRAFPASYSNYTSTMNSSQRANQCKDIRFGYSREDDWFCTLGPDQAPAIFAYGDSHALNVLSALEAYAEARQVTIRFVSTSGCPPLLGVQSMRGDAEIKLRNCRALNERVFASVRDDKIPVVLLAGRWSVYTGNFIAPSEFGYLAVDESAPLTRESSVRAFEYGLAQTVSRYHAIGVKVFFVDDSAQQRMRPRDALRRAGRNDAAINAWATTLTEHIASQAEARAKMAEVGADGRMGVDDALCRTRCDFVRDGKFLYFDDDHLSASGSRLLTPALTRLLDGR
jgi:peptidoglycan/LPS O-acetylase OafA/YrhL